MRAHTHKIKEAQVTYHTLSNSLHKKFADPSFISSCQKQRRFWEYYLQANNLACYSFMDGGRGHETLGSETKDFIFHSNSSPEIISICISSLSLNSHRATWREPGKTCTHSGYVTREEFREPELKEPEPSIMGGWACLLFTFKETLSESSKAGCYTSVQEKRVWNKGS